MWLRGEGPLSAPRLIKSQSSCLFQQSNSLWAVDYELLPGWKIPTGVLTQDDFTSPPGPPVDNYWWVTSYLVCRQYKMKQMCFCETHFTCLNHTEPSASRWRMSKIVQTTEQQLFSELSCHSGWNVGHRDQRAGVQTKMADICANTVRLAVSYNFLWHSQSLHPTATQLTYEQSRVL